MASRDASTYMPSTIPDRSVLDRERHIKYWLRNLKTYLPTAYTSTDPQRMTLAFFTLSALDILGVLHEKTTSEERKDYVNWIIHCQHPRGGFRGFTGTMYGESVLRNRWDAANIASTYFALAALIVLGEGMERVRRKECLNWVRSLQRANGSFGEILMEDGRIEGPEDMRFCHLAAGIRWILRRDAMKKLDDIDVKNLVNFIEASVVGDAWKWSYCQTKVLTAIDI